MKHLAKIQSEFLKEAANWNQLSYEAQKEYLKQHPKSKRRLTAKQVKEEKVQETDSDYEITEDEIKDELENLNVSDFSIYMDRKLIEVTTDKNVETAKKALENVDADDDWVIRNTATLDDPTEYDMTNRKKLKEKREQLGKENLSLDTIQVVDPVEAIESLKAIGVEAVAVPGPLNDEIEVKSIKDDKAFAKWFKDGQFDAEVYPKIAEYFKNKNIVLE